MTEWQPIATAPKDETVLIYIPNDGWGIGVEIAHSSSDDPDGNWYSSLYQGGPIDVDPTHWQPLPDPPSGDT